MPVADRVRSEPRFRDDIVNRIARLNREGGGLFLLNPFNLFGFFRHGRLRWLRTRWIKGNYINRRFERMHRQRVGEVCEIVSCFDGMFWY